MRALTSDLEMQSVAFPQLALGLIFVEDWSSFQIKSPNEKKQANPLPTARTEKISLAGWDLAMRSPLP